MDLRFSLYSSPTKILNHVASTTKSRMVMMCANNNFSVNLQNKVFEVAGDSPVGNDPSSPSARSTIKNKINSLVFEDRLSGIVCYKDENGEITCEGYDEGPRFHQEEISRIAYNLSDVEMIDLIQRCWLHVADEGQFNNAQKGVPGQRFLL